MEDKLNNFPEGTSRKAVIDELIDHDDVREIVLKQFNYMRINGICLLYTSPSPRDKRQSRMPSSA